MTLRRLVWMLEGFQRASCDLMLYLAQVVPIGLFTPKNINESLNPYRQEKTSVLSPEQEEAKRQAEGKRTFKMLGKALRNFVKNKPKKANGEKK